MTNSSSVSEFPPLWNFYEENADLVRFKSAISHSQVSNVENAALVAKFQKTPTVRSDDSSLLKWSEFPC